MNEYFTPNPQNYYMYNPINIHDQLWCGNGFPVEIFYKIDFWNIKKDTYIISSYGRIFSLNTNSQMSTPRQDSGYCRLKLVMEEGFGTDQFNKKSVGIHQLVAKAFIVKTIEDYEYKRNIPNHKNLIRCDNHVWNLEWVNEGENSRHAVLNNARYIANLPHIFKPIEEPESQWGKGIAIGDRNGKSRLTEEQVDFIYQKLIEGYSAKQCCELLGLEWNRQNSSLINNIKHNRRRQSQTDKYSHNFEARPQFDYSLLEPKIIDLLSKGFSIKQVYEVIKNEIPFNEGDTERSHYDRVRMKISKIKKLIQI